MDLWIPGNPNSVERALERAEADGSLAPLALLPGPWQNAHTKQQKIELLTIDRLANMNGSHSQLYAEYQQRYGDRGLGSNIAIPTVAVHSTAVINTRTQPVPAGFPDQQKVTCRVILADPADAERISRIHVRKEPNFGVFMDR